MRLPIEEEFKFSKSEYSDDSLVDYDSQVEVSMDRLKAVHELVQKANEF
jgi:hypothetical protein